MILKLIRALKFSLFLGMFLPPVNSEAQIPDTTISFINYDYNYIENESALSHLKSYFIAAKDSIAEPFRILHIGDSHVKSGFFAETFAQLMDSTLRSISPNDTSNTADTVRVKLLVMARNGATAKIILQSVFSDSVVEAFDPNLVIVSLGTNEAYNNLNIDTLAVYQEMLIQRIFQDAPECDLLITTPGDGMKKHYSRVRISKKRRRYKTVVRYENNEYLPDVIDYYDRIPERMDVAVWNFYPVMGGEESIKDWKRMGLAQHDMIHLTRQGYQLQAELLFKAVMDVIEGKTSQEE